MSISVQGRQLTTTTVARVGFFFGGCATSYEMKVDAISQPQPKANTTYQIRTKIPPDEADTLRAQEAEIFVKSALSNKGLYEAPDPNTADVVVEVAYGVEAPRVRM